MQGTGQWYSTRVRLVCVVDPVGATNTMDCIHIFRAADWDDAFQRALKAGRTHEQEYDNADGHRVRWRFREVASLDLIRAEDLDGAEVHSAIGDVTNDDIVTATGEFHPESSQPAQTM